MKVNYLKLNSFRNYLMAEAEFVSGINFVFGANGAGKTSLVESLSLLSLGKSFRGSDDEELIREGDDYAVIKANVENVGEYLISISKQGKNITLNNQKVKKISDIISACRLVYFLPKESELFHMTPDKRRRFLDLSLSTLSHSYIEEIGKYRYYLKALKDNYKFHDEDYQNIVISKLAEYGNSVAQKRRKIINRLNQELQEIAQILLGDSKLQLSYLADINSENADDYQKKLKDSLVYKDDKLAVRGIHLDDMQLTYEGRDAGKYASQGQNRLGVIALKLAMAQLIKKSYGQDPLLIFDDVLSELDSEHKKRLLTILKNYEQVFITGVTCKESDVARYQVQDNQVRRII